MIANFLVDAWRDFGPALANHIWQSTIFAAAVAALTLAFRTNRAGTRYWLWLAASLKFLVPFSLLVSVGSYLTIPHTQTSTKTVFYSTVEQLGQPFAAENVTSFARSVPATPTVNSATHYLPLLLIVWLIGSLVVLAVWFARWLRIAAIAKSGTTLHEGPEAELVAQLQGNDAARDKVAIVSTGATIEPGIFGIFRPVLLWPASISGQLTEAHTESIVAHELCHVRRRDNLTAALHMLVESLFWFHPAVWWLGNRLVEDRERACDEAVVESGREPHVYAESILKVCEFCVESPLPCVPGVSGADLKRRIASIMSHRPARALSASRKLLLAVAFVLAIAAPILAGALHKSEDATLTPGQTASSPASYASVSITPNTSGGDQVGLMFGPGKFFSKNGSLEQVIRAAYAMEDDRIVGAPDWLTTEKYDVVAEEAGASADFNKVPPDLEFSQQGVLLQAMLADRLKLAVHRETRSISVYALVVAPRGPKLKEAKPGEAYPNGPKGPDGVSRPGIWFDHGTLVGQGIGMDALQFHVSRELKRTVLNETGLAGKYDFRLQNPPGAALGIDNTSAPSESYEQALSANLESQLGLKLEPRTARMEVLVIDHVERPTPNQAASATPNFMPDGANFVSVSVKLDEKGTDSLKTGNGVIRQRMHLVPGEFHGENNSVREMIRMAYGVKDYQIFGAPDWLITDLYDVDARTQEAAVGAAKNFPEEQRLAASRAMLQQLLADRFQLQAHFETKQMPAYSLVVVDSSKLRKASGDCAPAASGLQTYALNAPPCGEISGVENGSFVGNKAEMPQLAKRLAEVTGREVEDKTNLAGRYEINLKWEPQYRTGRLPPLDQTEPANPSLLAAVQNQLGLKLVSEMAPLSLLVIDHVERPGEVSARR
jgi:bla regulator protein BlaR1